MLREMEPAASRSSLESRLVSALHGGGVINSVALAKNKHTQKRPSYSGVTSADCDWMVCAVQHSLLRTTCEAAARAASRADAHAQ